MFNDDDPAAFKKMQEFDAVDGFLAVTEDLADMIKYVANEPSVGLFYVQKHIQNAAPNLIGMKNNIVEKSRETLLHTEDLEDSIIMVRSMKECGFPIAEEMIGDIKKSLSIMSRKQPKKGLLSNSSSGYIGRASSWSPATSGHYVQDGEKTGGYLSGVLKSAKRKVNFFKWPQVEYEESNQSKGKKLPFDLSPAFPIADDNLTMPEVEGEDLSSSKTGNELQEDSQLIKSLSHQALLSLYENYDEFKANSEAKLEEWLGSAGKEKHAS